MKKVFWVVGEPSGDVQAAAVVKALFQQNPVMEQVGWGGHQMASQGVVLSENVDALQIMGFVEVLWKLGRIFKNIKELKQQIIQENPSVLVLVDYPGMNVRIAKWAKSQNFKVVYYIPPKVWAWKSGRAQILEESCDEILSILPFEKSWYSKRGFRLNYVGNPLAEKYRHISAYMPDSKQIALLPGSRPQELKRLLPVMFAFARKWKDWNFVWIRPENSVGFDVELPKNVQVSSAALPEALRGSSLALVCSGTATLEVALLGVPQVVLYKANPVSLAIAKAVVKLPFFSLPNLIADAQVVPELLQEDATYENINQCVKDLLQNSREQLDGYEQIWDLLETQSPAARAAEVILSLTD